MEELVKRTPEEWAKAWENMAKVSEARMWSNHLDQLLRERGIDPLRCKWPSVPHGKFEILPPAPRPTEAELEWRLSIIKNRCAICEHLKLEQKEPAILREDLFMPLVHPRILPPEKFHQENLLICDECWKMCT